MCHGTKTVCPINDKLVYFRNAEELNSRLVFENTHWHFVIELELGTFIDNLAGVLSEITNMTKILRRAATKKMIVA